MSDTWKAVAERVAESGPVLDFVACSAPGAVRVIVDGVYVARCRWNGTLGLWEFLPWPNLWEALGLVAPAEFGAATIRALRTEIRRRAASANAHNKEES